MSAPAPISELRTLLARRAWAVETEVQAMEALHAKVLDRLETAEVTLAKIKRLCHWAETLGEVFTLAAGETEADFIALRSTGSGLLTTPQVRTVLEAGLPEKEQPVLYDSLGQTDAGYRAELAKLHVAEKISDARYDQALAQLDEGNAKLAAGLIAEKRAHGGD